MLAFSRYVHWEMLRDACLLHSVADLDLFFTDLDPGIFPDPDPGQKHIFSKAITKFWEQFLFSTKKVGILF